MIPEMYRAPKQDRQGMLRARNSDGDAWVLASLTDNPRVSKSPLPISHPSVLWDRKQEVTAVGQ